MLYYSLSPTPKSHLWQITLRYTHKAHTSFVLRLPNWVPGSYMIRDFSRHIISIEADCNGQPALLTQTAKNLWQTEAKAGDWQIHYTVYAFDLSVRGSYLTTERGFFDGACMFLSIEGQEQQPCSLTIDHLPQNWHTASTLPCLSENHYQAANYAELIDHPFEFGTIETICFQACGIPHRIALSGDYADFDRERLSRDIQKICEAQLQMFPHPAPFKEYLFMLYVGDNIYGGLEHISSTALQTDRKCLPRKHMKEADEDYTLLLGLFSHEYFHAWNVKSIKPAAFLPYRLDSESYTEQLWAFEGITSYYDDLFLVRSGVISPEAYLKLQAKNLTRVQQSKGRTKQTLAQSSFTAWNKYYKQDENSPNAIVSYYQKGALAAMCLDLLIRQRSNGQKSLDNIMCALYQAWLDTGKGLSENEWQQQAEAIVGLDLQDFFQTALFSTNDLPLEACLKSAGIALKWQSAERSHGGALVESFDECRTDTPDFGARFKQNAESITLTHIFNNGSAEHAALCAQDKVIALNGFCCSDFARQWSQLSVGETATLHYFRQGVLKETEITVKAAEADTAFLKIENRQLLEKWLGCTEPQPDPNACLKP
ncbi:M61 family metallopeptidase [Neisseria canis]|uniref:Peptidase M61 n=1 Tax=Neisseria canis TaxID=493 RepID=A0A1X3D0W4_9NEIS|nr:M61 family metallopeptidase [Neisseria canis]OSI13351.1 peptidase [Neisseria canis]VEE99300.1 peptidase M61 [Neisseria canis]